MPELRSGDLHEGRRYTVTMDDCCIAGSFTAHLVEARHYTGVGSDLVEALRFDNGVTLTQFGYSIGFEEAPDAD